MFKEQPKPGPSTQIGGAVPPAKGGYAWVMWVALAFLAYKLFSPNPGLIYAFVSAGTRAGKKVYRRVAAATPKTRRRRKSATTHTAKHKSTGKPKRKVSAKVLANLARGRAKRLANLRKKKG